MSDRTKKGDSSPSDHSEPGISRSAVELVVKRIADAANEGRLLLFVGTGFSRAVLNWGCNAKKQIPGWTDLLKCICKDVGLHPNDFVCCSRKRNLNLDCPAIATAMSEKRRGTSPSIKDSAAKLTIWIPRLDQQEKVGEMLFRLNPSAIVTTNYDEVLEGLLGETCKSLSRRDEVRVPMREKTAVWHFHGRRDEPKNIVLTREDYIEFFRPGNYAQTKLAQLLHDHFTVFVGYSLSDMNLLSALDWAQHVYQTANGFQGYAKLEKAEPTAGVVKRILKSFRQVVLAYDRNAKEPVLMENSHSISCPVIQTDDVIQFLFRVRDTQMETADDREMEKRNQVWTASLGMELNNEAVSSLLSSGSELETELIRLFDELSDKSSGNPVDRNRILEALLEVSRQLRSDRSVSDRTRKGLPIDSIRFLAGVLQIFHLPELPVAFRIRFLDEMETTLLDRKAGNRLSALLAAGRPWNGHGNEQDNLDWLEKVSAYGGCPHCNSFAKRTLRRLGAKGSHSRNS